MAARSAEPPAGRSDQELFLARMTSPRLRSMLEEGAVDLLVPLGALEQHGPHLSLGTDTIIATALSIEVAKQVGDLLVAPCLPVGCSDHHLSFAGTASIPEEVVAGYIRSVALSLLGHGFRYAFIVSGHAGNIPAMKAALRTMPSEAQRRMAPFVDWPAQREALHSLGQRSFGLSAEEVGSHAGHFETSMMLDLVPNLVDMTAAPRGFIGPLAEASRLMMAEGIDAVSEFGVVGDASSSTAAAGAEYFKVLVASISAFIKEHRATAGS